MDAQTFNQVLDYQLARIRDILGTKAAEYADDRDRLHNFKVAAATQSCTPIQAAAGMMVKHTVSIFDMARSEETYHPELWDEKITDHINYLILIRALAMEAEEQFSTAEEARTMMHSRQRLRQIILEFQPFNA